MCTTFVYQKERTLYGRNMDIDRAFGEKFVYLPKSDTKALSPLMPCENKCYDIFGVASVFEGVALFAEGMNEQGLYMASLNFPGNAYYNEPDIIGSNKLAPYEVIPYVLRHFASASSAQAALAQMAIVARPFNHLPLPELHYFLSDGKDHFIIEPTKEGLKMYRDKIGVLTNNPTYSWHVDNLERYQHLSVRNVSASKFSSNAAKPFAEGLGLVGLPGDFSSPSRYVRTAFLKHAMETAEVNSNPPVDVLHILDNVAMPLGSVVTRDDLYDITRYRVIYDFEESKIYTSVYDRLAIKTINLEDYAQIDRMSVEAL